MLFFLMCTLASSNLHEELLWAFPRPTRSGLLGLIFASLSARHSVRRTLPKQPAVTLPVLTQIQYNVFFCFFFNFHSIPPDQRQHWCFYGTILVIWIYFILRIRAICTAFFVNAKATDTYRKCQQLSQTKDMEFYSCDKPLFIYLFIPLSRRALRLSIFFI